MHCPNCRHILSTVDLGNIVVEHCNNCGGTVFETNEINRITLKDAERLALMKQTDVISGSEKISPRDGSVMKRISSKAIPQHITLLQSQKSGEVFAFPDDLVEFKKAQDAKVSYFKTWHIPMPAIQNVLVFSLVLMAAASVAYVTQRIQQPVGTAIQAESLCRDGVGIIKQDNSYLVSCTAPALSQCNVIEAQCNGKLKTFDTLINDADEGTIIGTVEDTCTRMRFLCGSDLNQTDWVQLQ